MKDRSNNTKSASKSDVQELKKYIKTEIALVKLDMKDVEQSLDDKNRQYKDEILTGLDEIMKELETMRQENTVGSYQLEELRERVTKLESPSV